MPLIREDNKYIQVILLTKSKVDIYFLLIEEVEKFTDRDRYFNAIEAINYGLADEIINKIEVKKMK